MAKPVKRKRYKNKTIIICENCMNCMYEGNGDMYCDEHNEFALVYEDFCPTDDYLWCNKKKFVER